MSRLRLSAAVLGSSVAWLGGAAGAGTLYFDFISSPDYDGSYFSATWYQSSNPTAFSDPFLPGYSAVNVTGSYYVDQLPDPCSVSAGTCTDYTGSFSDVGYNYALQEFEYQTSVEFVYAIFPGLIGSDFTFSPGAYSEPGGSYLSVTSVPEPEAWVIMLAGFGLAGAALRRRGRLQPSS